VRAPGSAIAIADRLSGWQHRVEQPRRLDAGVAVAEELLHQIDAHPTVKQSGRHSLTQPLGAQLNTELSDDLTRDLLHVARRERAVQPHQGERTGRPSRYVRSEIFSQHPGKDGDGDGDQ